MKNLIFIFFVMFVWVSTIYSQENPSFENWMGTEPDINAEFWMSNNEFAAILGVDGQFVYQVDDATDGSFSANLVTKDCPDCILFDLPSPLPGYIGQYEPYSSAIPEVIEFDYKFLPAAPSDTAYFQAKFTHSDNGIRIEDAYGDLILNPVDVWTTVSVTFLIDPNAEMPDSLDINFWSSIGYVAGFGTDTDGSSLFIDNIKLVSPTTGIGELLVDNRSIQVYPNPSSDYIIFNVDNESVSHVHFVDVAGKVIQQEKLNDGETRITFNDLLKGNYLYIVYAKDGRQMKSGNIFLAR